MPDAVGGIAKGTKLEALEGRSISSILDDLLFPTVVPTYTNPSVTLTLPIVGFFASANKILAL